MHHFWNGLSPCGGRHAPSAAGAQTVSMMVGMKPPPSILALMDRPWLVAGLLGLLTFLVFLPAVSYDFVNWDDGPYVYENPLVLSGLSAASLRAACTEVVVCCWAPLTMLSYQLDSTLLGTRPAGYHLTNVLLHAAAVAALYVALVRMTAAPGRTAAAMLLFAIHPLRVESVAWIAERKDVLSVFLLGVTLIAYEWYCRAPCVTRYLAVCAAMLAGLLAKATLVTVPALLLLLDCWPLGRLTVPGLGPVVRGDGATARYPPRPLNAVLAEKLPLLAISAVFIVITLKTQQAAIQQTDALPLLTARLPNAVHATAWYVWKTFCPTELVANYRHPGIAGWPLPVLATSVATLVALSAAAMVMRKKSPCVAVGLAWFAVSLSPVIGIVAQQGGQAHADRYSYVPHIGLMIAVVWAAAAAIKKLRLPSWAPLAMLTTVATILVVADQRQITIWRDSAALWNRVIDFDPDNWLAHYLYGLHLHRSGDLPAAVAQFQHTVQTMEDMHVNADKCSEAHNALGVVLRDAGREAEAAEHFDLAATLDPTNYRARKHIGMLQLSGGSPDKAVEQFQIVVSARPHDPDVLHSLVIAHAMRGDLPAAILACRRLVAVRPTAAEPHSRLGQLLLKHGDLKAAVEEFRTVQRIDPEYPGIPNLLNQAMEAESHRNASPGRSPP